MGTRILMLNYEYPPIGGGASTITRELSTRLTDRAGFDIDIVTMSFDDEPAFEEDNGVQVHRVPSLRRRKERSTTVEMASFIPSCLYKGTKLLRKRDYDVIHSHFIVPTGIAGTVLSDRFELPHVISSHGSDVPGYNPDAFKYVHRAIRPLSNRIAAAADVIVSPSKYFGNVIMEQYPVSPDQITTLPHGFDPTAITPAEQKTDSIFMASRLVKRKGFQRVIRAASRLDTDYRLRIAGEGPYREELEDVAAHATAEVELLGWLDREQLHREYSESKIFALPSLNESFGVVLMEAMAGGNAIVTSNNAACSEVVGEAGLLVDPLDESAIAEALDQLISNRELRSQLQSRARDRIEGELNWSNISTQYERLYTTL
jgi:glycosyltransferase involved in cell wall biosynthesis